MSTPGVTLTFTLVDTANNPIKGKVVLTLDNFLGIPRIPATNVIAQLVYTAFADSMGQGSVILWGNYQTNQPNTFYQISVYGVDSRGDISNAPSSTNNYRFSAAGTFDLDSITPINNTPFIVPPNPGTYVVTNPTGTQTILTYPLSVPELDTPLLRATDAVFTDVPTFPSQNANLVFAGPASGGAATPTFRDLTASDIPFTAQQGYINVQAFGAKGDGKYTQGMNTTVSSASISLSNDPTFGPWLSNAIFETSDIGSTILIYGAGSANLTYIGTITAVADSTHATVSPVVPNAATYGEAVWGQHDDTTAIQNAINAAIGGQNKVYLPPGVYLISSQLNNLSSPFFYGIVGGGSLGTVVARTDITTDTTSLLIQDAPFGFELGGFTLFCQGQLASSLTSSNGVWFSTNVQIPKERIYYHDVRVSQAPQKGLIVECSIVSLFDNFTCDNCGVAGINFAPALTFAGTSTTVNNGYANNCGASGWLINGLFYSTFNSCASDSNVISYDLQDCTADTFNSCGSEAATGNPWNINEVTSTVINSPYVEIDQAVVATQVMFNFLNNCADITLTTPFCVINGDVTNGILIASNCAYITIVHPIINNFSFTDAGPVTDNGYANLLIYDQFEDGLTFKTNDNQTFYNFAIAGNDINIKNAYCGILTPNYAPPVMTADVTFSGWGGAASLNYTEGFSTAYGVGINCLGTASPLSAVANAVTVSEGISSIVSNGLTTTYYTAFSPAPLPPSNGANGTLFVYGTTNAENSGTFTILYSDGTHIIVDNPNGVNETPPSYPTAGAQMYTATYTGTFSTPYSYGQRVLCGGFTGGGNVGEFHVLSCNSTTLVTDNGGATAETASGTAWVDDQTVNPTITVTYETPFLVPPTPVVSSYQSDDITKNFVISDSSETSITFTLLGTPINGFSYAFFAHTFASY